MSDQPKPTGEWTADTVFKLLMSQEDDQMAHEAVADAHNAALARMLESRDLWKQWCVNAQDQNQPLREQLAAERDVNGCSFAGPGRGDCEHFVGYPSPIHIPNQHDGPDDTVDVYDKPNGWCWSCWKSRQLAAEREAFGSAMREVNELRGQLAAERRKREAFEFQNEASIIKGLNEQLAAERAKVQTLVRALKEIADGSEASGDSLRRYAANELAKMEEWK